MTGSPTSSQEAYLSWESNTSDAEKLSLEAGRRFGFTTEWTWDDVEAFLMDNWGTITEKPDLFVLHLGMNNVRTGIFILMQRLGMLDETDRHDELKARIPWLFDGSHHSISVYHDEWCEILGRFRLLTDCEEASQWYEGAQDRITVYRGYDAHRGLKRGIAWSLDETTARRFAFGMQGATHELPCLLTAEIDKVDIAGVLFGREQQVLIIDSDTIHIIKAEDI